jgi:hypothetical protein
MREGPRRTLAKHEPQESEVVKVNNQQQEAETIKMTTYTFMLHVPKHVPLIRGRHLALPSRAG